MTVEKRITWKKKKTKSRGRRKGRKEVLGKVGKVATWGREEVSVWRSTTDPTAPAPTAAATAATNVGNRWPPQDDTRAVFKP